MELYVGVLVGVVLYLLLKLNKAKRLPDFTIGKFMQQNWIPVVINLILGFSAVYAKESVSLIYPLTFVTSLAMGAAGEFIWKGLFDAASPGVSTYIGMNE